MKNTTLRKNKYYPKKGQGTIEPPKVASIGQGTIEYLIIIAIVVVIALVVVGLLTGFFSTGSGVTTTNQAISQQTQNIALTETALNQDGNYLLEIQSNETDYITINKITIDEEDQNYYTNNDLTLGTKALFIIPTTTICQEGTNKTAKTITLTYTTKNGITKTHTYNNVIVPCQNYQLTNTTNLAGTNPQNNTDTTPPELTIQTGAAISNTIRIIFSASDNNAIMRYDRNANISGMENFDEFTPQIDGQYYYTEFENLQQETEYNFCIKVTDYANNQTTKCRTQTISSTTYTLTINTNGEGSTTGAGTHQQGSTVNITATPQSGWEFINWSGQTSFANANSQATTLTMPQQNITITANFTQQESQNLVARYLLHGNGNDEVGGVNLTAPNGSPNTTSCLSGNCYSFNGSNQYLSASWTNLPIRSEHRTVCSWVKTNAISNQTILKYGLNNINNNLFRIMLLNDGKIWFNGYYADVMSNSSYTTDEWMHICFSYNGAQGKMYINGQLDATENITLDTPSGTNLEIARMDGTQYFNGNIEDIRFWNYELSADEITQVYSEPTTLSLREGLVGYWPLNENNSSQPDESENNNTGTVYGATYTASGKLGGAYNFNSGNYVYITDNSSLQFGTQNFSISAWIKKSNTNQAQILYKSGYGGGSGFTFDDPGNGYLRFGIRYSTSTNEYQTNFYIADNVWHHVVAIRNGESVIIYVNNVKEQQDEYFINNNNASAPGTALHLGNGNIGQLDEVAIWNRALTEEEIITLYNNGDGLSLILPE